MSDDEGKRIEGFGQVVQLPTKPAELRPKGDYPFQLIVNRDGYCAHASRLVCHYARTVECKKCGAKLDPFDVLMEVARDHNRWETSYRTLAADIRAAESRIKLLKRLEENARARAKRLGHALSRYKLDGLVRWARDVSKREVSAQEIERELEWHSPERLLEMVQKALADGRLDAAAELLSRFTDEVMAALQTVAEERRA